MSITFLSPKVERDGFWSRRVEVAGIGYRCAVERAERVRIPYKPRGTYGFRYMGSVWSADGRRLWIDYVAGSIGCRGLLKLAGIL